MFDQGSVVLSVLLPVHSAHMFLYAGQTTRSTGSHISSCISSSSHSGTEQEQQQQEHMGCPSTGLLPFPLS